MNERLNIIYILYVSYLSALAKCNEGTQLPNETAMQAYITNYFSYNQHAEVK